MSIDQQLLHIDALQDKISGFGKLPEDVLKKINYKFRLEWNYTSNSMEGNSLTRSETRSVMIGNITVSGKPIKDVLEVKGHDEVITTIMKMGRGELNISEKRIKEIHTAIMYEEDPEKKALVGQWKKEPNYLYNYKNERFDFVAPADVPERMHSLVNWVNAEKDKIVRGDKDALHPVMLALRFNLEYVTIHPFFDGNGRTSRILTNLILISYGYPPLYIKENERKAYYQYLADIQGYGGAPDVFYEYMTGLIIRSQQIVLDAIEGKDIEEKDDLDKKLMLLEAELSSADKGNEVEVKYSYDTFIACYNEWLRELTGKIVGGIQKFNKFFITTHHYVNINDTSVSAIFKNGPIEETLESLIKVILVDPYLINNQIRPLVTICADYDTFNKGGARSFSLNAVLTVKFEIIKYIIYLPALDINSNIHESKIIERLYHQPLTEEEIDTIAQRFTDTIYQYIDYHTKKLGLR